MCIRDRDFINHDLVARLGISGLSVGYDFHFGKGRAGSPTPVSYTHLRAHETVLDLVCRLLLEKKKHNSTNTLLRLNTRI